MSFVGCLNTSLPFIQLLLFVPGGIRLYFKLLLKLEMHLNIPRAAAHLLEIKITKERSPKRWRFSFTLKGNEITDMQTDPSRKHPRNTRVISPEKLATMLKNNLREINLVGGHAFSCLFFTQINLRLLVKSKVE